MKPAFVLRLLQYRATLAAFVEERRASGIALDKLTITTAELSEATSVPVDVVHHDLVGIGFRPSFPMPASSLEVGIDVRLRSPDLRRLEAEPPLFRPEIGELSRDLHQLPIDVELAEAREKARAVASDHSDSFTLALGAFTDAIRHWISSNLPAACEGRALALWHASQVEELKRLYDFFYPSKTSLVQSGQSLQAGYFAASSSYVEKLEEQLRRMTPVYRTFLLSIGEIRASVPTKYRKDTETEFSL